MNEDLVIARQSLSNFVGAIIETSNRTGEEARHEAVAALVEESMHLSEGSLYVSKPIYRGVINMLLERRNELSELGGTAEESISEIDSAINYLKKIAE